MFLAAEPTDAAASSGLLAGPGRAESRVTGISIDPDTLNFSYTPVEDPSVYENVFTEFIAYMAEKTGKNVKWYGADSYASQV